MASLAVSVAKLPPNIRGLLRGFGAILDEVTGDEVVFPMSWRDARGAEEWLPFPTFNREEIENLAVVEESAETIDRRRAYPRSAVVVQGNMTDDLFENKTPSASASRGDEQSFASSSYADAATGESPAGPVPSALEGTSYISPPGGETPPPEPVYISPPGWREEGKAFYYDTSKEGEADAWVGILGGLAGSVEQDRTEEKRVYPLCRYAIGELLGHGIGTWVYKEGKVYMVPRGLVFLFEGGAENRVVPIGDKYYSFELEELPEHCFAKNLFWNTIDLRCTQLSKIPKGCFEDTQVSVLLPPSVVEIGEGAFRQCILKSINLENVYSVGAKGFSLAQIKSKINFDALSELGSGAFYNTDLPPLLDLSGTQLKRIPADCFMYSDVEKVRLPPSIKTLGEGAFAHTYSLREVNLPPSIETLGGYAFARTVNLLRMDLSKTSIEVIPSYCFSGSGIQSIQFPGTLKKIQSKAFLHCGLKEVDLRGTQLTRLEGAFIDCYDLRTVYLPEALEDKAGNDFRGCPINTQSSESSTDLTFVSTASGYLKYPPLRF